MRNKKVYYLQVCPEHLALPRVNRYGISIVPALDQGVRLSCEVELEAPHGGSLLNPVVVALLLEACEEAYYRNLILPVERMGLHLHVQFLPITVNVSRYSRVVARITPFQAVGLLVEGLGKQVVGQPNYHGPSAVSPQSKPELSARATTVLIRLSVVTIRVGRVVPVTVSAFLMACTVAPPSPIFRARRIFIRGVSSLYDIAILPVAILEVIAVSPKNFFAVVVRPVTGVFFVGILSLLRFGPVRAGGTSSALPVRIPDFLSQRAPGVFCVLWGPPVPENMGSKCSVVPPVAPRTVGR